MRFNASPALWIALSPDGARLASCDQEGKVHLWDVETATRVYTLTHDRPLLRVEFSPDGRTLAAGTDAEGEPGVIRLWQAR